MRTRRPSCPHRLAFSTDEDRLARRKSAWTLDSGHPGFYGYTPWPAVRPPLPLMLPRMAVALSPGGDPLGMGRKLADCRSRVHEQTDLAASSTSKRDVAAMRNTTVLRPAAELGGRDGKQLLHDLRSQRLRLHLRKPLFHLVARPCDGCFVGIAAPDSNASRHRRHGASEPFSQGRFDQSNGLVGSLSAARRQCTRRNKYDRP